MKWLKNTKGIPDAMLTFALVGLIITSLAVVASFLETFSIGDWSFTFRSPDATIVSAFLGATLLAYVNRRNRKDEHDHELKKIQMEKTKEKTNDGKTL